MRLHARLLKNVGENVGPKGSSYEKLLKWQKSTCKAKGWEARTTSLDRENWRYATICVERLYGHRFETVTAVFEVSLDDGFRISPQQTSLLGYGLQDLFDAIRVELDRLPWLNFPKKAPRAKSLTSIQSLERLIKRFHIVALQLGHRYDNRETLIIQDEYDVQDLLHALLKTVFDDVRREEVTPSYAGA